MNDDFAYGTAIASDILANDSENPRAVRVFNAAGKHVVTLTRKPASESEVLGDQVDVHLDPDRDAKVDRFFYHLAQLRALKREIEFYPYETSKVSQFFNRLRQTAMSMRELGPFFQGSLEIQGALEYGRQVKTKIHEICSFNPDATRRYLENQTDLRRLTRELVP